MYIPYHIRRDNQKYSLDFVADSRSDCHDFIEEENTIVTQTSVTGRAVIHLVYTPSKAAFNNRFVEQTRFVDDELKKHWLQAYHTLRKHSSDFERHKQYTPDGFDTAMERVRWKQSVPNVAAEILSSLIRQHALPNANHRSAISFTAKYLATYDPTIELPLLEGRDSNQSFMDELEAFVHESKRLLTISRNTGLIARLAGVGVDGLVRDPDVVIDFEKQLVPTSDFDSIQEAGKHTSVSRSVFIQSHVSLCRAFIRKVVDRCDATFDNDDRGKRDTSAMVRGNDAVSVQEIARSVLELPD